MAFLDPVFLNTEQFTSQFDEHYFQPTGIVALANESSPGTSRYMNPEMQEHFRTADSRRSNEMSFIQDETVTVTTQAGMANIPDNISNFQTQAYVAVDVQSGFTYFEDAYENTFASAEFDRNQKTRKIFEGMAKAGESAIQSVLEARKTQLLNFTAVAAPLGGYTFDSVSDTLQISRAAQDATTFWSLNKLMMDNDIGGLYRFVTSRGGTNAQVFQNLQFGAANSQDKQALGFAAPEQLFESNAISVGNPVTDAFNGWAIRDGAIGIFSNHPKAFRENRTLADTQWSITPNNIPFVGQQINVWNTKGTYDGSGLINTPPNIDSSNLLYTTYEKIAFWWRFYIVFQPNSDLTTRVNDIIKINGLQA